jgi:hypothetical protein
MGVARRVLVDCEWGQRGRSRQEYVCMLAHNKLACFKVRICICSESKMRVCGVERIFWAAAKLHAFAPTKLGIHCLLPSGSRSVETIALKSIELRLVCRCKLLDENPNENVEM